MLLVMCGVRALQKSYVGVFHIISLHYRHAQSTWLLSTMQDDPLLLLAQNNQTNNCNEIQKSSKSELTQV